MTWDGANGLFTRLGKIAGMMKTVRAWQSQGGTLETEVDDILGQFDDADLDWVSELLRRLPCFKKDIQPIIDTLHGEFLHVLAEMLHEDDPLPANQGLPGGGGDPVGGGVTNGGLISPQLRRTSNRTLLRRLADRMATDSEDFAESTTSSSVAAAAGNTGNGTVLVARTSVEGDAAEFLFAEDIELRCIADARSDPALAGLELFDVRGEPAVASLDPDWPKGSGAHFTTRCAGTHVDASRKPGANMLVNSGFEVFTVTNKPDNWVVVVGTVGSDILEIATAFRDSKAVKFINSSTGVPEITQAFDDPAAGTSARLVPKAVYGLSIHLRRDTAGLTGTLEVKIADDTGDIVIATVDLSTLTDTYVRFTATGNLFRAVNGTAKAYIKVTVAMPAGEGFYADAFTVARMVPVTPLGPHLLVLPGSTDWETDDVLTVTMVNNNEGEWLRELNRMLDIQRIGFKPPTTSGAESILDSLIS